MNIIEEENFPRGGKKPRIKSALKRPKDDDNVSKTYNYLNNVHMFYFVAIQYRECFKS